MSLNHTIELIIRLIQKDREKIINQQKKLQEELAQVSLKYQNSKAVIDRSKIDAFDEINKVCEYYISREYVKTIARNTLIMYMSRAKDFQNVYDKLADIESKNVYKWRLTYLLALNFLELEQVDKYIPRPVHKTKLNNEKIVINEKIVQVSNYKIRSNESVVNEIWRNNQYLLEDILYPQKGDIVFDLGGYHGETAIWFYDKIGKNGHVYVMEPFNENRKIIYENINTNKLSKNITVIPYGIWSSSCKCKMDGNGLNMKVVDNESCNSVIEMTTLDFLFEDRKIDHIDFIKMDIEGSELEALKGAAKIIKRFKPKLAISIYHKAEDLIEIPNFILELVPEYKLYISHKCNDWCETILFAKV
ncbi:FkbM family methyltransferase [Abyssisolibacter fermentans]|uniref:FkbM family methyltransferase n=1 Tax=Abyssisolibacter fermentans TaxID=1766203 RepID=UPI000837333D|nr:FkbM family methyltransferase [Abyssisolibacter fermentans]